MVFDNTTSRYKNKVWYSGKGDEKKTHETGMTDDHYYKNLLLTLLEEIRDLLAQIRDK